MKRPRVSSGPAGPEPAVRGGSAGPATGEAAAGADVSGQAAPFAQPRAFTSGPHISDRRALLLLGDLAASNLALLMAVLWRGWWHEPGNVAPGWWFVSLTALALLVCQVSDSGSEAVAANPFAGSYASARAGLITAALYLFTPYLSAPLPHSRAAVLIFIGTCIILRVAWRLSYVLLVRQPRFATRMVIVGSGASAQSFTAAVRAYAGPEHEIVGCVHDAADESPSPTDGVGLLGSASALDQLVDQRAVSLAVLAVPGAMSSALSASVMRAYESGIRIVPMAAYYEALTGRVPIEHVGDYWMFAVPAVQQDWLGTAIKRAMDIVGAMVGLAITVVLLPVVALAIRLSGRGPVLYSQTRVGERGRRFRVHKFRTMATNAEDSGEAVWAAPTDQRATWVGRWLRASRLDELPQFWNVLRGQMSLVGPRPERPEFIARLQPSIPFYRARLLVRPGLTGWAQVKQGYAGSLGDSLVKLQYDLYYINHQSLYLDLLILLKTIGVVLRLRGR